MPLAAPLRPPSVPASASWITHRSPKYQRVPYPKGRKKERRRQKSRDDLKQEEQENLENLQQQLDQYIQKNGFSSELETQLNQSQLLITILVRRSVPSGSADVKPESQKLAAAIAQMLHEYPDYEIRVTGHTDNQPINTKEFPSNWELSTKRATNFMKILLENPKFDPKLFSATGYKRNTVRSRGSRTKTVDAG